MDNTKIINEVLSKLRSQKLISSDAGFEVISSVTNIVVKINDTYLKIYTDRNLVKDNELELYSRVGKNDLFKEIIYQGITDDGSQFALHKGIKGITLDKNNTCAKDAAGIAKTVYDFINCVAGIPCEKFGELNENFDGTYNSLKDFLTEFHDKNAAELHKNSSTKKYAGLSQDLLNRYSQKLAVEKPTVIPTDINMRNIMIADDGKIKIIDPGALAGAVPEMAYGSFCANTFGTPVYEEFEKLLPEKDNELIRVYAILHLLYVMSFIVRFKTDNIETAKPFGHDKTFVEQIEAHLEFLNLKKLNHVKPTFKFDKLNNI